MLLVLGGIKGGSGKSTLAVNLAVARARRHTVLLVDGDDQQSTTDWWAERKSTYPDLSPNLDFMQVAGKSARDRLLVVADRYDTVIVDTGGRDTITQRAVLSVADRLLIPFQPRSVDIWTIKRVSALIAEILTINPELKCEGFINRAFANSTDNDDAMAAINEADNIQLIPLKIGDRKAFSNSFGMGLIVPEIRPRVDKAIDELQALYAYCFHSEALKSTKKH
jgi:chromosome partitioning protein